MGEEETKIPPKEKRRSFGELSYTYGPVLYGLYRAVTKASESFQQTNIEKDEEPGRGYQRGQLSGKNAKKGPRR